MDFLVLADRVHKANEKWWQDLETGAPIELNYFERLQLALSEVSEAMEGERKNLMDTHLPYRKMAEVEMADTAIRLLDMSAGYKFGLDLDILQFWSRSPTPENKGEGLFHISKCIVLMDSPWDEHKKNNCSRALGMIFAYCKAHGHNFWQAFEDKMEYNSKRPDHKPENRRQEGGVKW